ncbi:hypothetical protein GF1_16890 [Desulfolithobacter dissulfuricans]|uniref:Uncharacterized protein n=1 Tax=Desulfolithobacter dissulfuricans TaxID=2795293 RepID=A0A915XKJ5_9BACT|nr:hypothetical protein [Desulfolithobacter dissulfuricans]BCO09313.1 hypothetical protein GF1_16890 [Desulfolithobacter dissulfuricans]
MSITKQVEAINAQLRSFGREAVQEIKMVGKNGQVIGQVRYGYKPQYVFDAVNAIIGPENWRYEVVSKEIFDNQAVVDVKLFVRVDGEWLCKGVQAGQMQIVRGNVGDAMKGAITDGIQKCMSLLSIGSDAYKGLLKEVYLGRNGQRQPSPDKQPARQPTPPSQNRSSDIQLPKIDGISYRKLPNGTIYATGKAVYSKRELLKSAGFRWDKAEKVWAIPAN